MTASQTDLIVKIRSLKAMFMNSECDMIPPEVKTLVQDMNKRLIDSMHKCSIFYIEDRKIWRTTIYVEVEEGGVTRKQRKFLSAKSKPELYEKLYEFYIGPGTLDDIHNRWVEDERSKESLAPKTLSRERQRWDKYIKDTDFSLLRIDEIDNFTIEEHLRTVINKQSITKKELNEIMFLLRKVFNYAFRHKIICTNPYLQVEVNDTGCAPTSQKENQSRLYLPDEVSAIQHEIDIELLNCPWSTTALAIRLIFLTGMRAGEIVALKASDVDWTNKTIHVQRMEQEQGEKESYRREIVNYTKKKSPAGNRILGLGDIGIAIINQVMAINEQYGFHDDDFLFLGEKGKRIHERAIDNRIRKLCKRAGIQPAKSAHDIRRTVATTLYRNTLDIELTRKHLGHADTKTTMSYIILSDQDQKDRNRVVDALSSLSAPSSEAPNRLSEPSKPTSGNIIAFNSPKAQKRKKSGATAS